MKKVITSVVALFAAVTLSAEVDSTATNTVRRRPVHPPASSQEAATLSGRVVDAATRAGLANATVQVGTRSTATDATGAFTFPGLTAGGQTIVVKRAGYADLTQVVQLRGGANSMEFALSVKALATLTKLDLSTVKLDPDTIEFGYVVTFVGYDKVPGLRSCDGTGALTMIPREQIARIPSPAVDGAGTCCTSGTAQHVTVELKSGATQDVTLRDSCQGFRVDLIAMDATTGKPVFVPMSQISRLTMP